ncbi:MFS transporter [Corynebacterium falsenii]|uniref:MFS transporter n=1 Tax=Corynebacterium falsenii TaxID=108486 RepID=UPI0011C222E2|nr:MFS transporter [Corynebacterium falsenii]
MSVADGRLEGRAPVSRQWITRFGLLYLAQNMSWSAPSQLLLAQQILAWYPENKEQKLALLMAIGGVCSVVGHPLTGWLSDRTRGRWGNRIPWVLGGAVVAAVMLVLMPLAGGFVALTGLWAVFQLAIAGSINAGQAIPPDEVPERQYGVVSGVMGLTYTLAIVVGTGVAAAVPLAPAYWITAAAVLVGVVQFVVFFRPGGRSRCCGLAGSVGSVGSTGSIGSTPPAAPDAPAIGGAGGGVGRRYADLWWVFVARFLVTAGNMVALFYLFYFLRDGIGYANPDGGVLILTVVYAVCVVLTAVVSGRRSDASGRRKIYVIVASLGVAAACAMMAVASTFAVVVGAAVLLGLSWGVYMAVDQALINEVLPQAGQRGRDLGLMNVAVAGPNMAAPLLAAASLSLLGGYPGLYLFAGVLSAVGAVLIMRVRTVR